MLCNHGNLNSLKHVETKDYLTICINKPKQNQQFETGHRWACMKLSTQSQISGFEEWKFTILVNIWK